METAAVPSYQGFRSPAEIIALYHRFPLSYREVEERTLPPALGIARRHAGRARKVRALELYPQFCKEPLQPPRSDSM